MLSPHGVPADLLDRLLILRTLPYTLPEAIQILAIRAQVQRGPPPESCSAATASLHRLQVLRLMSTIVWHSARAALTCCRSTLNRHHTKHSSHSKQFRKLCWHMQTAVW